jgi:glycosyltransferase involved in cell wall biosynthesis
VKLLLIGQQYRKPTSGLGTYARVVVEGLRDRGHEVILAAPRSQCDPAADAPVLTMDFEPWSVTPFTRRRVAREFRRVLAAAPREVEVVHFLDAREAGLASAPEGTCAVGSVHDSYALDWRAPGYPRRLYPDRWKRGLFYRWLRGFERAAYRGLDRLATNCRHVSDRIVAGYGLDAGRVEVVPLGLPPAEAAPAEPLSGDPSILFVGAGFRRKGLYLLVAALERILPDHPDLVLHVVGGGREAARIERSGGRPFSSSPLRNRVVLHGARANEVVLRMMAGADLLAVPSFVEAVGLVYLEAMQAGTPVVASGGGGTPEYLTHERDALLVPPGDLDALGSALRRILADRDLRERLVAAGRETAGRYSAEGLVTGLVGLYERALSR